MFLDVNEAENTKLTLMQNSAHPKMAVVHCSHLHAHEIIHGIFVLFHVWLTFAMVFQL